MKMWMMHKYSRDPECVEVLRKTEHFVFLNGGRREAIKNQYWDTEEEAIIYGRSVLQGEIDSLERRINFSKENLLRYNARHADQTK